VEEILRGQVSATNILKKWRYCHLPVVTII